MITMKYAFLEEILMSVGKEMLNIRYSLVELAILIYIYSYTLYLICLFVTSVALIVKQTGSSSGTRTSMFAWSVLCVV